jgi:hypothetical protein
MVGKSAYEQKLQGNNTGNFPEILIFAAVLPVRYPHW